jgi:hypothetical protein
MRAKKTFTPYPYSSRAEDLECASLTSCSKERSLGFEAKNWVGNMMRILLPILLSALSFVCGCVSVTTFNYDEDISSASTLAEACRYQCPETIIVLGRERSLLEKTKWDDHTYLGDSISGDSIKREIETRCGGTRPTPGGEATVTVYYLTYVNRATLTAVSLPSVFLSVFTLGLSPLYSLDSVALCLDITLPEGGHRYGLSQGSVVNVVNLYGLSQDVNKGAPSHETGRDLLRKREMLGDLLLRALHKAWIPGQGNLAQPNCKVALNSMIE